MSEQQPSKEAIAAANELVRVRLTSRVSEISIGNLLMREVANEPQYAEGLTLRAQGIVARALDAFAAASIARREAEIVARLEEMAKRCESDARVLAKRGMNGATEMMAARAYRVTAEAIEDGDI